LEAEVLLSAAEGGDVGGTGDEGGMEDVARGEEIVHPLSPGNIRHDSTDVSEAVALCEDRFLFLLSNLLSI